MVQPARDLAEAGSLGVLAADASDHVGREGRLAAGPRCSPPLYPRLLLALGEVAREFADRNQPRAPVGLDGCDRRNDAPVERRQADAEHLRCLLSRVGELLDRPVEPTVVRRERTSRASRAPLLLLRVSVAAGASPPLTASVYTVQQC